MRASFRGVHCAVGVAYALRLTWSNRHRNVALKVTGGRDRAAELEFRIDSVSGNPKFARLVSLSGVETRLPRLAHTVRYGTLIYHIWNVDISELDMDIYESSSLNMQIASNMLYKQLRLPRIMIGTMKGNVSAVNILKECLNTARDLRIREVLLMLGPTSPLSLGCRTCQRILWATFLHDTDVRNNLDPVIVPPTHLTDLSVSFEKLSNTKNPVRLLLGDFLDNVLPVSTDSAAFTFLCTLLTKIRESEQTAFFLLTEDMHDARKVMMVKRFADVLIEYRNTGEGSRCEVETRTVDLTQDRYSDWKRNPNMDPYMELTHHSMF